ncbi:MAG: ABC transporter ATP-binding protein [Burkholderiales bacterium]
METPALRFRNVTKNYAKAPVLKGVDVVVEHGESFAVVGINGAGKTTLIKGMLDLCGLDGGSIEIYGIDHRLRQARKRLAFLPERLNPPAHLTGTEFLRYITQLHGTSYVAGDVERMFDALDLDLSVLSKPVYTCSKGMAQKLGLAACFLRQPDLYVFDEPMSGLDPKARALVKQYLRTCVARNHTLFFTSHALSDVEEIGERMAILHQGALRFVGTPAQCRTTFGTDSLEQAFLCCIA